jgi:hypothetical protein
VGDVKMDRKILTMAIVAIVIVAFVGAAILLTNPSSGRT